MRTVCFFFCLLPCIVSANATNYALLVGIGDYETEKTGWRKLHGDADVSLLKAELLNNHFLASNITTLVNERATKQFIVSELKNLAGKCKPGDAVFFHFSGHGQLVTDVNNDEPDNLDESIVPYDAYKTSKYRLADGYYYGQNHLIDDELSYLFSDIKDRIGSKGYFMITIDACYSRGIEKAADLEMSDADLAKIGEIRGSDNLLSINKKDTRLMNMPRPKQFSPGARMCVVTACREDERNFEYRVPGSGLQYGSLSYSVFLLLKRKKKFVEWEKYFNEHQYRKDNIFCTQQHPKIITYR